MKPITKKERKVFIERHPILHKIMKHEPLLWQYPHLKIEPSFPINGIDSDIIYQARDRFERLQPLLAKAFHHLNNWNGLIITINFYSSDETINRGKKEGTVFASILFALVQ